MGAGIPPAYLSFYLDIPVAKDTFHLIHTSIILRIGNSTMYNVLKEEPLAKAEASSNDTRNTVSAPVVTSHAMTSAKEVP